MLGWLWCHSLTEKKSLASLQLFETLSQSVQRSLVKKGALCPVAQAQRNLLVYPRATKRNLEMLFGFPEILRI